MIEFKKESKEIVEYFMNRYEAQANLDLKAIDYVNNKIIDILKDDERYGKLLKTNHKILLLIDELRNTIKKFNKQEELFKGENNESK